MILQVKFHDYVDIQCHPYHYRSNIIFFHHKIKYNSHSSFRALYTCSILIFQITKFHNYINVRCSMAFLTRLYYKIHFTLIFYNTVMIYPSILTLYDITNSGIL